MVDEILTVEGLTAGYRRMTVLHNVRLSIRRGDVVALLGANGAGKSTLLRSLSSLLKTRGGTIVFDGRDITNTLPNKLASLGLGHVPEGRQPFPQLSVRENLWMGSYSRSDRAGPKHDLDMVLEYFPILRERSNQQAGLLSGGEQQMLVIGRALMARPKLLLLDEPSLGLSPKLVSIIFDIIRRINLEQGVSILLVEQNAALALSVSQHGYVLESGQIVLSRPSVELMQLDHVKSFYLGHHVPHV